MPTDPNKDPKKLSDAVEKNDAAIKKLQEELKKREDCKLCWARLERLKLEIETEKNDIHTIIYQAIRNRTKLDVEGLSQNLHKKEDEYEYLKVKYEYECEGIKRWWQFWK